ncbi:MAG: prepilin-type N-terminal cleavage/methylation domain-containing protein [Candidatus Berkelbacteria bacterium]|nr:prepilin-type N-terminal cleavage/methylation domain-containing protein [Candidatus Berkelbacteria bacterium]
MKSSRAFSLIELLAAMVLVAVLAVIVVTIIKLAGR